MKNSKFAILFGLVLMLCCFSCKKAEETIVSVDFGEGKYKEPFRGLLSSHPQWLVSTLDWPVLRSLRPDTLVLTKTIEIGFNEDAVRSHSTATIQFVDDSCNRLDGVKVYCNGKFVDSDGYIVEASSEPQLINIAYKIDPLKKECTETGHFIISGVELDEVNTIKLSSDTPQNVADWTFTQKIGWPLVLWLLWLLMALIILVVLVAIIVFIVKVIGGVFKGFSKPNSYSLNSINGGGLPQKLRIPKSNGHWSGEPGNSKWMPNRDFIPKNKNYGNRYGKTMGQILDENNTDGITFRNNEPDFTPFAKYQTKIDYENLPQKIHNQLLKEKPQRTALHDFAYNKIAKENGMTYDDILKIKRELNLTPHETLDGRIQLVPYEIHENIEHEGGVALFRALFL